MRAASSSTSSAGTPWIRSSTRFVSASAVSNFWRRILGSRMSWTRIPMRAALSAYAGPIPRRVVPIWSRPSFRSLAESTATCHGMIRCALPEMRTVSVEIPRPSSSSSSSTRSPGSTTQPAPTTHSFPERIPDGTWWSANRWPSITIVCPALGPPW